MNLYLSLRLAFHSLLVLNNLFTFTAAAWSISASKNETQASPGAVLVIVGCIGFVAFIIITWADVCVPRTQLSRVRTEATLVPMLIVFQLIGAAVVTSNTINSLCRDLSSCGALVVLSWSAAFSLLVYFLMILAITFDHAILDPDVWDASLLHYPWFIRPPPKGRPPGPTTIIHPMSLRAQPSIADYRRQQSSWIPFSSRVPSLANSSFIQDLSLQDRRGSAKFSFLPRWAKDLRPLQRGRELPFPIAAPDRPYSTPRRIDDPVAPAMYTESS